MKKGRLTAIIKDGRWECSNKVVEELLNLITEEELRHYLPDVTRQAVVLAKRFGWEEIEVIEDYIRIDTGLDVVY